MNKLALISISLVSFVSIAAAQTPPAKAPATPATPAAKAPATPATPAKGAPAVPADKATPAAADKMAPPKPPEVPAELVATAKSWGGTWKCTGQSMVGDQMMDTKATITHAVDATLNKFWIKSTFVGSAPKMPPMKSTWYTTYDNTSKKLWRVSMTGRGGHTTGWGTIADKKVSWEADSTWADGSTVKLRTSEEWVSPKELKVMGEASKDGGKTWAKELDATCKK
jgi:hypothetical protein